MEKKRNKMNKETLEEYISEVTKNFGDEMSIKFTSGGIKLGAKWQSERMYSEEEVILLIAEAICKFKLGKLHDEEQIIESLEKFKKK
jgi:hypothetical protein